jgi:Rhodopirellula transposase DDE domain
MIDRQAIRQRWDAVGSKLDERGRRLFAAAEVQAAGYGGLKIVSEVTGIARSTINRGEDDLDAPPLAKGEVRRAGGGRRAMAVLDPGLIPELKRIVDPASLGDPMRPLIWVSKSMDKLAAALTVLGHPVSGDTVARELVKLGFSRQYNRKADEGSKHPDRNAQFEYINAKVLAAQAQLQPVISVDTKKKELIGNFKNGGSDLRPKGDPRRVNVHDFMDKELGKVAPYGDYDVTANTGFVSVGITSDTAEFAVQSIRTWLERMGRSRYSKARALTITADCGGSNGARVRLWNVELQKLADETGLALHVHHYPPGTSKWNKIEHRMFCYIQQNWRGRPLTDRLAVVELIGATTTKTGLKIDCAVDTRTYEKGIKVSDAEMAAVMLVGDDFHPEWNYTISPRRPGNS